MSYTTKLDIRDVIDNPSIIDWNSIESKEGSLLLDRIIQEISTETIEKTIDLFLYVAEQGQAVLTGPFLRDLFMKGNNKDVIGVEEVLKNRVKFGQIVEVYKNIYIVKSNNS